MDRWIGKVAVVTGASSGIGASLVPALAAKGIIVVALDRMEEKLNEVAAASKGKVHAVKCDLTKEQDILKTFEWVEKTLGGVDILINNAGIVKPASLSSGSTADWDNMLRTNVLGLSICTKEALKTMRKRGDNGHIIHLNSVLGHIVCQNPEYVPSGMYSATKHAVNALTEALRVELQSLNSNIKITSMSPGNVYTEMALKYYADITGQPVQPPGPLPPGMLEASDISDAILYCLGTRPLVQVHDLVIQAIGQKW